MNLISKAALLTGAVASVFALGAAASPPAKADVGVNLRVDNGDYYYYNGHRYYRHHHHRYYHVAPPAYVPPEHNWWYYHHPHRYNHSWQYDRDHDHDWR